MRFTRTSHSTLLTKDDMHLRQRAEEILALGLINFTLMIKPFPLEDYHYIRLPEPIPIDIVTRDDSKWAKKSSWLYHIRTQPAASQCLLQFLMPSATRARSSASGQAARGRRFPGSGADKIYPGSPPAALPSAPATDGGPARICCYAWG